MEENKSFSLFSDVFMSVALEDIPACQHVLRILTGIPDLTVHTVKSQYTISKLSSKDARLDILAEDADHQLYIIEIQRSNSVDHPRRVRFYSAMADSEFLAKGEDYEKLPELYLFYISEKDIWKSSKTVYPVEKYLGDEKKKYDDGQHIIFVNGEVDDHSEIAKLMNYFKSAAPEDDSQGELSKRVKFLKTQEGGLDTMCEVTDRIQQRGEKIGELRGRELEKRELLLSFLNAGADISLVKKASGLSDEEIEEIRKSEAS